MSTVSVSSYIKNKYPMRADLHTHSISSGHGSTDTITDMVKSAAKAGVELLGISEHGPATMGSVKESYFRGLKLAARKRLGVELLYGVELNIIDTMGNVDLSDEILSDLDYALVSIHPPTLTPYANKDLTEAYLNAMNRPNVKFLGHIDDARFPSDFERVLTAAKKRGIYPEINNGSLMPEAYRVGGQENCRRILEICKRIELPVLLSSDSHGKANIGDIRYIYPLLVECDFPEWLVLNGQVELLKQMIAR